MHHADRRVVAGPLERVRHLESVRPEGVAHLGPVDRDLGHQATGHDLGGLVADVGVVGVAGFQVGTQWRTAPDYSRGPGSWASPLWERSLQRTLRYPRCRARRTPLTTVLLPARGHGGRDRGLRHGEAVTSWTPRPRPLRPRACSSSSAHPPPRRRRRRQASRRGPGGGRRARGRDVGHHRPPRASSSRRPASTRSAGCNRARRRRRRRLAGVLPLHHVGEAILARPTSPARRSWWFTPRPRRGCARHAADAAPRSCRSCRSMLKHLVDAGAPVSGPARCCSAAHPHRPACSPRDHGGCHGRRRVRHERDMGRRRARRRRDVGVETVPRPDARILVRGDTVMRGPPASATTAAFDGVPSPR